jgi:hypothetical protein
MPYPTVPTGRGQQTRQTAPTHCPNGHELRPPNVQVTYNSKVPGQARFTGWRCWTCGMVTWEDGDVTQEAVPG